MNRASGAQHGSGPVHVAAPMPASPTAPSIEVASSGPAALGTASPLVPGRARPPEGLISVAIQNAYGRNGQHETPPEFW